MTTQAQPQPQSMVRQIGAGVAFIVLGAFLLIVQNVAIKWLGLAVLPGLALIFLAWGLFTRTSGLLIPGGILAGLGAGAIAIDLWGTALTEMQQGGVFMLAFAGGWALITLASTLIGRPMTWPLIPGGIMLVVSAAAFGINGAQQALELAGRIWPVIFIIIGLGTLLGFRRKSA